MAVKEDRAGDEVGASRPNLEVNLLYHVYKLPPLLN